MVFNMAKYGCMKYGAELYDIYPPDDIYTSLKRFKEKEEDGFRIEVNCTKCHQKSTFFWVKK